MTIFIENDSTKFIVTDSFEEFDLLENIFKHAGLDIDPNNYDVATENGWLLSSEEYELVENLIECLNAGVEHLRFLGAFTMAVEFAQCIEDRYHVKVVSRERYNGWKQMREWEEK